MESESEKFARIVKRHKPKGWRVLFSKRRNELLNSQEGGDIALAIGEKRIIRAPYVIDVMTLHILLHEFGHIHLKHWTTGKSVRHREEFEAERWAMEALRMEGISVPRAIRTAVRKYIMDCIEEDRAKGIEIEPHVLRYAEGRKRK